MGNFCDPLHLNLGIQFCMADMDGLQCLNTISIDCGLLYPLFLIFRISCQSRQLTGKWGRILNLANFIRKDLKHTSAAAYMLNSKRKLS